MFLMSRGLIYLVRNFLQFHHACPLAASGSRPLQHPSFPLAHDKWLSDWLHVAAAYQDWPCWCCVRSGKTSNQRPVHIDPLRSEHKGADTSSDGQCNPSWNELLQLVVLQWPLLEINKHQQKINLNKVFWIGDLRGQFEETRYTDLEWLS